MLVIVIAVTTLMKIMERVQLVIFFDLNKSPITRCSQKQETIALSSCEDEYMAASATSCQVVWLCDLVMEITGEKILEVVL